MSRVDRRDLILTQLFDLLKELNVTLSTGALKPGSIVRNRNDLPKELTPGIVLMDADEVKDPRFPENNGRGGRPGPGMMKMTPEIYIVLGNRKPHNEKTGEDLNLVRVEVLNLILHDPVLQQITGTAGSIIYDGCVTDLARNRTMQGQMGLSITFSYPYIPDEFSAA